MSKRAFWTMAGLIALLAIAARIIPGPRSIDDAYITFRFARNILSGQGFAYNPGEAVLGTSTALYTMGMALLGSFSRGENADFPRLAWMLNAVLDAALVLCLILLGRKLGLRWAGWGSALAWALAPFSVTFAIGGLETSLYVLLLCTTFLAYLNRRFATSALLASFSLLTRPDALLLVAPLALHRLLSSRMPGKAAVGRKEWLALLLPYGLWALYAFVQFGSPLPHSVLAKSSAYQLEGSTALVRLLQHYATPFQGHLVLGNNWIGIGLILFPFLYVVGARMLIKRNTSVVPFVLFPWFYFTAFALANPLIFRWYLAPPLPFLFLFILTGLENLVDQIAKGLTHPRRLNDIAGMVLIIGAPALLLLNGWTLKPDHAQDRPAPEMAWIELELLYAEAADYLVALPDWEADAIVAAGDVGVLGYQTRAPILDLVGLNSVQSVDYYPLEAGAYRDFVYAIPSDLILDEEPDFVVFLEIYGRQTLLSDGRFAEDYDLIHSLPSSIYDSHNMLIYQRTH